ncbi:hypothetical protein CELL_01613 [Cellulomonas sp. T2.31MG-18]|uniref:hypothetical protein n=1 Tax=Cellulomonas sp. T2.31MG-18 TaxID=3157619 RepID=UPI0035EF8C5A
MSYDILAFDPGATADDDFEAWWDEQAQWPEGHGYNSPSVSTPALQAFYRDVAAKYPPMNGPDAPQLDDLDEPLESRLTDYSFGRDLIYGAGSWRLADELTADWERIAREHGIAVAFVSNSPLRIVRP